MLFDPLDVEHIGVTLAIALVQQKFHPLPLENPFVGGGVYAIYYVGSHPAYSGLQALNSPKLKYPIYVGKAVRSNAKSGFSPSSLPNGTPLFKRINTHSTSIEKAKKGGLKISDFKCKYLPLNDAYVSLAESVLISTFRPPWNGMGLGSNQVGEPRSKGMGSLWDSLHPGRGGRPAGDSVRRKLAAAKIQKCLSDLAIKHPDPVTARMLKKIMKFV